MTSGCHQQGGEDRVLESMLNPQLTTDPHGRLSCPVAPGAPATGVYGAGLVPRVVKSHTIKPPPVHDPISPSALLPSELQELLGPWQATQSPRG